MVLHDDPHPSAYMLLCNYRYNGFRIKYALNDPAHRGLGFVAYHQLIASDPLGFLAYTHCLHCPKVEQNPEAKWYSDYEHRMLCLNRQPRGSSTNPLWLGLMGMSIMPSSKCRIWPETSSKSPIQTWRNVSLITFPQC